MKLTVFFLLTAALFVCVPAFSQRVSIHDKGLTVEAIFKEIRTQTGLEFFYQSALLAGTHAVALDVDQMPVDEVLKLVLRDQGLDFTFHGGTVIVFRREGPKPGPADAAMRLEGRVVDTRGQAVPMASAVLRRTRAGTQTDRYGAFLLLVKTPLKSDTLIITCIGYRERDIPLDSVAYSGPIVLQPADNSLDQSIVVAYGITSDRFRTGSVSMVSPVDIERSPAANVLEALAGRVPGLYVRQNGDNPTNTFTIQLRGDNVLPPTLKWAANTNTDVLSRPIIVIDGIPIAPDPEGPYNYNGGLYSIYSFDGGGGGLDDLYWLNPLDVESISVLKDAEATALYGSRAANGVILITTKKARPGKIALHLNFSSGINAQAGHVKLMDTKQYLAMRHEAWNNSIRAGLPVTDPYRHSSDTPNIYNSFDLLAYDTTRNTDWQKFLLGSAPVYNAGLELSGGEGSTAYRMSTSYYGWKSPYPAARGISPYREDKGTMALTTTSHSDDNRFKAVNSLFFSVASSIQPNTDPDGYVLLSPDAPPVFDKADNFDFADWRVSDSPMYIQYNPLNMLGTTFRSTNSSLLGRTSLSYELFPSFVATFAAGYSRTDGHFTDAIPQTSYDPLDISAHRMAYFGNSSATDFDLEPNLRYTLKRGRHYLEVFAGGSYQADKQHGTVIRATGYGSDAELTGLLGATQLVTDAEGFVQRKTLSGLGRISYRWSDAILADLCARRDGSSSFGPDNRYGNFGSVGAGWIFTESSWAKHIPGLSFGKIRSSYGITGVQSPDPTDYLAVFSPPGPEYVSTQPDSSTLYISNSSYQGFPALTLTQPANSLFGWAQAKSLDIGADLYFLEDQRLKFSVEWYEKNTGHQLVTNQVAAVTGTTDYLQNWPAKVRNDGVEILAEYGSPRYVSAITWAMSFNLAANRNKLVAFPGLKNSAVGEYLSQGQPLFQQTVYNSVLDGVHGIWTPSITGGIYTTHKVNTYPAFTGGWQSSLSYKGVSLSLSCTFAKQKGFANLQGASQPGRLTGQLSNQLASLLTGKHWQSPADSTIGGAFYASAYNYNSILDIYWRDASYIALKNATLTYAFPTTRLKKAGISGLSFYVRSENLLMLSLAGFKGFNIEQPYLSSPMYNPVVQPLRKTIVGGFNFNL